MIADLQMNDVFYRRFVLVLQSVGKPLLLGSRVHSQELTLVSVRHPSQYYVRCWVRQPRLHSSSLSPHPAPFAFPLKRCLRLESQSEIQLEIWLAVYHLGPRHIALGVLRYKQGDSRPLAACNNVNIMPFARSEAFAKFSVGI